jgi:Zn-dependent protease
MRRLGQSVTIGRAGLGPVLVLALVFAGCASRVGAPIGMAALLGGIGGTLSLIVHELGHAFAARRMPGIRCADVTLVWMGAATRFQGKYESGREQAKVAIAGPLMSFVLALTLLAACVLPMDRDVHEGLLLLCLFNVAIGALNLAPTFPLDGYKFVTGLVWSATGSEKRAQGIIRRIGVGWALMELPGAFILMLARPKLIFVVAAVGIGLVVQKRMLRGHRPSSKNA